MAQQIPVETVHLFPVLDKMLIDLLRSLSPDDWHKPTVAKQWTVKDVAAHLLDGNVRGIATLQGYESPPPDVQINSYRDLVVYLNNLNATWVNAMKRTSPQLLIEQLESTGQQYIEHINSLDAFAPAKYAVAWAGEETSLNWFHIAREYTEKWHHQQQIRDAIGVDGLLTPELFYPCIDVFMYALPHNYRKVDAPVGSVIQITVYSHTGGSWYLHKTEAHWILDKLAAPTTTNITITADTAWRMFTKALTPAEAENRAEVTGEHQLAKAFFATIAVMA
ncbi:maleylpyruvate isomerase family mycothiol-dependent enzyme [Mucilaginibacter conchicola]|uniref:Maleylpyruvate isomerase family mycothiol-dependent enzyme n=1 Tax=Mucilaginibacter conchicola TaxID=2303333 RepID=A0A372NXM4_9SPHI|nr:maleylpyruvate isomerase N-terminal domain-containing protein [Mucilaginibacter conchicola]RFZ94277.1 maleylpyruvate isomerase family mycothiol-dependent enzyme [Mucilaginibacter conchicola]